MASSRNGASIEHTHLAEAAIEAFEKAHALAPLDGGYALSLAFAYDELRRFEDAERMYAVAKTRDPRSHAVAQLYQAHLESRDKVGGGPAGSL